MIRVRQRGDFSKTYSFLKRAAKANPEQVLSQYGQAGVDALASATPFDTGNTAKSWYYDIAKTRSGYKLSFCNSNINEGVPIAIILQYGHGTGTGGWVEGRDYINPAVQPIFDKIAEQAWKEVMKP